MNKLRQQLRVKINETLDLCDANELPTVCRIAKSNAGRWELVNRIEVFVVSDGHSIADAISQIEQLFNSNLTD